MYRQIQDKNIKCIDRSKTRIKKCVDRSKTTKWIKAKGMNNLTMMRNLYSYQGKTTTD